ncbi:MAG TPA: hypothetical protein VHI50_03125, partial [Micromonosporaceae bacterium]|nr:hypothetical protein [Micromonosporaceae bacterium]
ASGAQRDDVGKVRPEAIARAGDDDFVHPNRMPGGGCRIPATSLIGGVGLEQIAATSLDVPPG